MSPADWTVALPLLALTAGAIFCFLLGAFSPKNRLAPSVALLAIAGAFALQGQVWQQQPGAVFGGLYESNSWNCLAGFLILLLAAISWGFASPYLGEEEPRSEFFGLLLSAPVGMLLMIGAKHFLLLFLGIEVLSIPLYLLCAFRSQKIESVESGLKYFLLGAFAAGFFLFGVSLIYAATGSMAFDEIARKTASLTEGENSLYRTGIALMMVGILFKASLAPFHFWTPDVYEGAPTPITALMAGGTKAAAFAAIANLSNLFHGPVFSSLVAVAILTLIIGNFGALMQSSLKRMLAYSGIAHAGILLIGVMADNPVASSKPAVLFYLVSYGLTAVGAFGMIAYLEKEEGADFSGIESYRGLSQSRPWAAAALAWFLLSLGGIPPTAGFLAKYFVFAAAVQANLTWLAIVGILFSVVSLGYYLRVIVTMYMTPLPPGNALRRGSKEFYSWIAAGTVAAGILFFGVQPGVLLQLFSR